MATILLVGSDAPLLEGLSQTLAASGHRSQLAQSLAEAAEAASAAPPLLAVVQRDFATNAAEMLRIPLAAGGTFVLFRLDLDAPMPALGTALQRAVIAELALPLERHRLIALVQSVAERARRSGRGPTHTPPEDQPPYRP